MTDRSDAPDPSSPERNPLGLGPRDREGSNTGSTADTSYAARDADPYTTGEPRKDFNDVGAASASESTPADPDTPSSDEP